MNKTIFLLLVLILNFSCRGNTQNTAADKVFTDSTYSELNAGITEKDINQLDDPLLKSIAGQLLEGKYPAESRIREFLPYPSPKQSKTLKAADFSRYDNPAGIWAEPGEELVVFAGDLHKETIYLVIVNDYSWGKLGNRSGQEHFILEEGINRLKVRNGGSVYIFYFESKSQQAVKLHFASGKVNGFFDINRHSDKDWEKMLAEAPGTYIDALGNHVHLCFPVEDFKAYCPNNVTRLVQTWDSIASLQQELIGLHKYNRIPKNRIFCVYEKETKWGGMYAGDGRTAYTPSTMKFILNPDSLRTHGIWGPAHEIGHMYQTRPGLRWWGTVEVTNNIHSLFVQTSFGNKSRLEEENRYNQGLHHIVLKNRAHGEDDDPFRKLVPFWQLYLYSKAVGYTDYYADLYELVRNTPDKSYEKESGTIQLDFVKNTCDLMKTDLTDFFRSWGLLKEIDRHWEGKEHFHISAKDLAEAEKYIKSKNYPKAPAGLLYLTDHNYEAFVNKAPIIPGKVEWDEYDDKVVILKDWQNVMAFEVYDGNELILISVTSKFRLPKYNGNIRIKAVNWKGESTEATI